MPPFSLINEEANVVLVGSMNPAIFHPEWFFRHGLITEDEHVNADVELVHPDLSKFSLQWLKIDVTRPKLIARTNDPSKYEPLRDLMISILKILEHTPISQIGINRTLQYKIETEELWHKIGDNLAPKSYWDFLPERVGLKLMNIQTPRPDELKGEINIGFGPVRTNSFEVNFDVNNHFEIRYKEKEKEIVIDAVKILAENWDSSLSFAQKSCDHVLTKALEL